MSHKKAEFVIVGVALFLSVVVFGLSRHEVAAQTDCDLVCLSDRIAALTRRVAALERAAPPPPRLRRGLRPAWRDYEV